MNVEYLLEKKAFPEAHVRLDKPQRGSLIDYLSKTMPEPSILNLSTLYPDMILFLSLLSGGVSHKN